MSFSKSNILAHRGNWKNSNFPGNSLSALEASFTAGYGIETDLWISRENELIVTHDPPIFNSEILTLSTLLECYVDTGSKGCLAFNAKCTHLQYPLLSYVEKYGLSNYFLFDMTVPDLISAKQSSLAISQYTRFSEYENCDKLIQMTDGIWFDCFHEDPSIASINLLLETYPDKIISIVSPELHGRSFHQFWHGLKIGLLSECFLRLQLCTDYPLHAHQFLVQMSKIKAVLFDMDGVLIDARDWHYQALNRSLSHFGYHIDEDAHLMTYDGLPTKVKLNMLSKARSLPVGLHPIISELKQKYTIEIAYQNIRPSFNHRKVLSYLKRNNYKLAVCSNSIRSTIMAFLKLSRIDNFFDLIISNEDVELPKPSPDMYIKSMNIFGVEPSQTLIFEDSEHGIEAALQSNANLCRIADPDDLTLDILHQYLAEFSK